MWVLSLCSSNLQASRLLKTHADCNRMKIPKLMIADPPASIIHFTQLRLLKCGKIIHRWNIFEHLYNVSPSWMFKPAGLSGLGRIKRRQLPTQAQNNINRWDDGVWNNANKSRAQWQLQMEPFKSKISWHTKWYDGKIIKKEKIDGNRLYNQWNCHKILV